MARLTMYSLYVDVHNGTVGAWPFGEGRVTDWLTVRQGTNSIRNSISDP